MNKRLLNTLFIIILSIFSLNVVKAADPKISIERAVSKENGYIYIIGYENTGNRLMNGINGLKCGDQEVGKNPVTVSPGVTMFIRNGSYIASIASDTNEGSITLNCTYEDSAYYLNDKGETGPGTMTIKLNYTSSLHKSYNYDFSMNTISNFQKRLTGNNTPFNFYLDKDYVSCDYDTTYFSGCGIAASGGVLLELKRDLVLTAPVETKVVVHFKNDRSIKSTVKIETSAIVIADYGGAKCEAFGEGWTDLSQETKKALKNNTATKKQIYYSNGSISLPNCEYNGSEATGNYVFRGWYIHSRALDGNTTVPFDICGKGPLYNGSVDMSNITDRKVQYERILYTCFENTSVVDVSGLNNDMSLKDGTYKPLENDKLAGIFRKSVPKGGTVKLPGVNFPSGIIVDDESYCWRSTNGECYKAGVEVGPGQYALEYTVDPNYTSETEVTITKEIMIGKTEELNISSYVTDMKSCNSSNSEFVTASYNAEKKTCTVGGAKVTGSDDSVEVIVKGKNNRGKEIVATVKFRVIDNSADASEGGVYNAANGTVYNVTGFLSNTQQALDGCSNYTIKPLYTGANKISKMVTIIGKYKFKRTDNGQVIDNEVIRENIYAGNAVCNGESVKIAAVCMDPARQEPSGTPYFRDHSTDVNGSYLDKLAIVIYNKPAYASAISHVADAVDGNLSSLSETDKKKMAAATLAYRVLAIKVGEAASNSDSGLINQYYAYKSLMLNINAKWGNDWGKKHSKFKVDTQNKAKTLFCNGANGSSCGSVDKGILKDAANLLEEALDYSEDKKTITVNAYVAKENTDINKNNGNYVKIIEGKYTDIPVKNELRTGHFLSLRPTCKACSQYGVTVKFEIGRDLDHLVTFDDKMNALTVKYEDFAEYKNKNYTGYLFDNDGTMAFRYTISGNINTISSKASSVSGGSRDGNGGTVGGVDVSDFRISTSVGVDGKEYILNTGQANPANSANFQRMEIFNKIKASGHTTDGTPGTGRTGTGRGDGVPCGTNCSFNMEAAPTVKITYNSGDNSDNMIINYNTYEVGTFLPACDADTAKFNYKTCTNESNCTSGGFDPVVFVGAGCCSRILDEDHYVYKTYCNDKCTTATYTPVCKADADERSTGGIEHLKLHEASVPGTGEDNFYCIYSNNGSYSPGGNNTNDTRDNIKKTKEKHDIRMNSYAMEDMAENKICAISCKEDWDFSLPNLKNYLGPNAVIAGQYFVVQKDKILKTTASRTCITTRIDIDGWKREICNLSKEVVAKFNQKNIESVFAGIKGELAGDIEVTMGDPIYYCEGAGWKKETHTGYGCSTSNRGNCNDTCTRGEYNDDGVECTEASWYLDDGANGKCDNGKDADVCRNPIAVTGPTINFVTYTFDCTTGIATVNNSYQFTAPEGSISNNFESGAKYGEGHCKKEGTAGAIWNGEDYVQAHGAYIDSMMEKYYLYATGKTYARRDTDWSADQSAIYEKNDDMKVCQHWGFHINGKNKLTDVTNAKYTINTGFDPSITYSYDEPGYMDQLASHNTLTRNDLTYKFEYGYYSYNNFNGKAYTQASGNPVAQGSATYDATSNATSSALIDGTGLNLDSSYIGQQLFAYCTNGGSGSFVSAGDKVGHGAGATVTWNSKAGCSNGSEDYIKNANYIKRKVTLVSQYESSEYKWYYDTVQGHRSLGKNPGDARQACTNRGSSCTKDTDKWRIYGDSQETNIVFPIMETTPRNIYQYAFTFYNLGNYNDNRKTGHYGRIMGTNSSVIGNNNRVCFYEVVEGICYCCGDTLETELVTPSTKEILGKKSDGTNDPNGNDLTDSGSGDYLSNYVMSMDITEDQLKANKKDARYGATVNSVSLYNIDEDIGDRKIGANWTDGQHYNLEGYIYVTDKGGKLLENIKEEGEQVYEIVDTPNVNQQKYPEYSYTLSPTALSTIRRVSSENGYQEKTETMELYGFTKLHSSDLNSWVPTDKDPGIAHYASHFLNETVKAYVTKEFENKVLSRLTNNANSICYVVDYGTKGFVFGSGGNVYRGDGRNASGPTECRWIDYVGRVTKANDKTKDNRGNLDKTVNYYRLSFK